MSSGRACHTRTSPRSGHDEDAVTAIVWPACRSSASRPHFPTPASMPIACVFPGQGSQSVGMGAGLFERFPDWTEIADGALGYSIRTLRVEDPASQLGLTEFTQPALYVVNAMTWRAREEDGRPAPAFLAGHSLGEYDALLAAGVFDFATGLEMVRRRGAIMGRVAG